MSSRPLRIDLNSYVKASFDIQRSLDELNNQITELKESLIDKTSGVTDGSGYAGYSTYWLSTHQLGAKSITALTIPVGNATTGLADSIITQQGTASVTINPGLLYLGPITNATFLQSTGVGLQTYSADTHTFIDGDSVTQAILTTASLTLNSGLLYLGNTSHSIQLGTNLTYTSGEHRFNNVAGSSNHFIIGYDDDLVFDANPVATYDWIFKLGNTESLRIASADLSVTIADDNMIKLRDAETYLQSTATHVLKAFARDEIDFVMGDCGGQNAFKMSLISDLYPQFGIADINRAYWTYFRGALQSGDITYTLPTASTTGYLLNTSGTWSWESTATATAHAVDGATHTIGSLSEYTIPVARTSGNILQNSHLVDTAIGVVKLYGTATTSPFFEFWNSGSTGTVKGAVGYLSTREMNMSFNMDYTYSGGSRVHNYYDSGYAAQWLAMNELCTALQVVRTTGVSADIWTNSGKLYNWYQFINGRFVINTDDAKTGGTVTYNAMLTVHRDTANAYPTIAGGTDLILEGHATKGTTGSVYLNYFNSGDVELAVGGGLVGIQGLAQAGYGALQVWDELFWVERDWNGGTGFVCANTTSGTAAMCNNTLAGVGSARAYYRLCSPLYTTDGPYEANSAALVGQANTAGLNIGTYDAYKLQFWTNKIARATILGTGQFGVGMTPVCYVDFYSGGANATDGVRCTGGNSNLQLYTTYDVAAARNFCFVNPYNAHGMLELHISAAKAGDPLVGSALMVWNATGCGINQTTAPLSALTINGGCHVGGNSAVGDNNLLVDGQVGIGMTAQNPISVLGGINGPHTTTLVNNSATAIFTIAIADLQGVSGAIIYTINAYNATDVQRHSGAATFSAVRKSTTYTANIGEAAQLETAALSSGTLTDSWGISGTGGVITITMNANSNLSSLTAITITYTLIVNSTNAITFN